MAATVEELQARLEALQRARAAGTREVRTENRAVVYKSDQEMAAAAADLQNQILLTSGVSMVHTVRVASSKGLDS